MLFGSLATAPGIGERTAVRAAIRRFLVVFFISVANKQNN